MLKLLNTELPGVEPLKLRHEIVCQRNIAVADGRHTHEHRRSNSQPCNDHRLVYSCQWRPAAIAHNDIISFITHYLHDNLRGAVTAADVM